MAAIRDPFKGWMGLSDAEQNLLFRNTLVERTGFLQEALRMPHSGAPLYLERYEKEHLKDRDPRELAILLAVLDHRSAVLPVLLEPPRPDLPGRPYWIFIEDFERLTSEEIDRLHLFDVHEAINPTAP